MKRKIKEIVGFLLLEIRYFCLERRREFEGR